MAHPTEISGLDCDDVVTVGAQSILSARLRDLLDLRSRVGGPEDSQLLHDLRIAAKRLRYSLEMLAFNFSPKEAQQYADRVRDLQDVLGRIHDLDVMQQLLMRQLERLDEEKRQAALRAIVQLQGDPERDKLLRRVISDRKDMRSRIGLLHVIAAKLEERRNQYARFAELWADWEQSGLLAEMRQMIERDRAS